MNLRSKTISLLFDYQLHEYGGVLDDLWKLLTRNAVEPGQASSFEFSSFADECLLCAQIVLNAGVGGEENAPDSGWDTPEHEPITAMQPPSTPDPPPAQKAGLIYLHAGPANVPAGEANIGVIIDPKMRRRGYAREAVQLVLRWAFEELKFHRVQAAILDTQYRDRAMRLFIGSGFSHEGTRRRAVYQPEGEGMAGVWRDVTYLAMLDTEWTLRSTWRRNAGEKPVVTVWDEMFERHAREREELVQWEEKHGRMRRSTSAETLRENNGGAWHAPNLTYLTDDDVTSLGQQSAHSSIPPSPKTTFFPAWSEDELMADHFSDVNLDQRWEEVEKALRVRRHMQDAGGSLPEPSPSGRSLALPSIPSTRLSDANSQSPLTIPSPTTSVSVPPPSPPPAPSSSQGSWADLWSEDNWSRREPSPGPSVPIVCIPQSSGSSGSTSRRIKKSRRGKRSSSTSKHSWSDAHSSVGSRSSDWDVISG